MKELSVEEKAKAYDEAVERLRNAFYDNNSRMCEEYRNAVLKIIEPIFPELAESEDERIRKWLIKDMGRRLSCWTSTEVTKEQVLAWLEKQGEKIEPIEGFNTEFERQVSHLIASAINREHEYNEGYVKWTANALLNFAKRELEKQGEQKSTWSEEDELHIRELERLVKQVWAIAEHENNKDTIHKMSDLSFFLKTLKPQLKQDEQKPVVDTKVVIPKFRVGDIVKSKSQPMLSPRKIISIGKDCYWCEDRGCIGFAWEDDCELVEHNPSWSEEDVAMLDSTIAFVEHSPFSTIGKGKNNVIAWLKNLKDKVLTQIK